MKQGSLLNGALSSLVARMGHGDAVVIGDAGLPIPRGPERIDLALTPGTPSFALTLETLLSELRVERAVLAEELRERNPEQLAAVEAIFAAYGKRIGRPVELVFVSHEELKERCPAAMACVRTGECSPYSNVILHSGVVF